MTVVAATWPAPLHVRAFTTTRGGGLSLGPYASLNLAAHVGDDPQAVAANRALLLDRQGWAAAPLWLDQVHGTAVVRAEDVPPGTVPRADAAVTGRQGQVLAVLTADCLPVCLCDEAGTVAGVVHAGWKGLLAGVLEAGLSALHRPAGQVLAWVGPAIAQVSYQVGAEVRDAYLAHDGDHAADFIPDGPGHWLFDLKQAAVRRLGRPA